ncbi:MAG: SpoVG family protein [Clostridia bacterium]|nr:SpoVG family protein [Clostridia bacterium]
MAGKKGGATMASGKQRLEQEQKGTLDNPQDISVRIDKLFSDPARALRAYASAKIGDFAVHGISVYENEQGLWVNMPQSSYTVNGEKKYEDIFHPTTADSRRELCSAVVDAYQQALEQAHTAEIAPTEQSEAPIQTM